MFSARIRLIRLSVILNRTFTPKATKGSAESLDISGNSS
jgi:hypothetical protein